MWEISVERAVTDDKSLLFHSSADRDLECQDMIL